MIYQRTVTPRIFLPRSKMVTVCAEKYPGMHPSDVVQHLRLGEGMTLEQVAKHLGVSMTTASRWQGEEVRYLQMVTDKFRESARRNIEKINVKRQEAR